MPAISKCLMCIYFLLMCHSPEFLMVQRSRSLILLSPAGRKMGVLPLGQLIEKVQHYLS
ncbi:hypothetical protein Celaphus_00002258 [Cervus elaphus hippelaphus]|uniref:Uncharacterized protein n=1 Tax=Cervus elaphus hippelaphus TaxID=46360 RepID=A0A212CHT8_CEREH|nr:hypothetical protein Celaphus_00002258 [Cervus elaphus hippelaphus]